MCHQRVRSKRAPGADGDTPGNADTGRRIFWDPTSHSPAGHRCPRHLAVTVFQHAVAAGACNIWAFKTHGLDSARAALDARIGLARQTYSHAKTNSFTSIAPCIFTYTRGEPWSMKHILYIKVVRKVCGWEMRNTQRETPRQPESPDCLNLNLPSARPSLVLSLRVKLCGTRCIQTELLNQLRHAYLRNCTRTGGVDLRHAPNAERINATKSGFSGAFTPSTRA